MASALSSCSASGGKDPRFEASLPLADKLIFWKGAGDAAEQPTAPFQFFRASGTPAPIGLALSRNGLPSLDISDASHTTSESRCKEHYFFANGVIRRVLAHCIC